MVRSKFLAAAGSAIVLVLLAFVLWLTPGDGSPNELPVSRASLGALQGGPPLEAPIEALEPIATAAAEAEESQSEAAASAAGELASTPLPEPESASPPSAAAEQPRLEPVVRPLPTTAAAPPAAPVEPPPAAMEPAAVPLVPSPTSVPPSPTPLPPTPTAVPPTPTRTPPPPPPPAAPVSFGSMEALLFNAHNAERARAGVPALVPDAVLTSVAQRRAADMAARGYFGHTSPSGETAFTLLAAAGRTNVLAGENIARNNYPDSQSAEIAESGFMNSPTHRGNILNPAYRRVGIAVVATADGMKYFVVVFSG